MRLRGRPIQAIVRTMLCGGTVALALAALLGLRMRLGSARDTWLWAVALASVNPLAVLFQRKIWAQSVLPIFCVLLIAAWMRRSTRWGAFCWGLLGALLGQVHMSGFFFAAALCAWTCAGSRLRAVEGQATGVRWAWWTAGSRT